MKATERPDWGSNRLLVWVDIETTGIDYDNDNIIEIAIAVTEPAPRFDMLDSIAMRIKPFQSKYHHTNRDNWHRVVPDFHLGDGGLMELANNDGTSLLVASSWLQGWIAAVCGSDDWSMGPMCGSSVGFDRRFLAKHLQSLHDKVWTYRNFDVSTLREWMSQLHGPELVTTLVGEDAGRHRAQADLIESIERSRRLTKLAQCGTDTDKIIELFDSVGHVAYAGFLRDNKGKI